MIMGMLIFVAFALARGNKNLLIGEAVEPEEEQQIAEFFWTRSRGDESSAAPVDITRRLILLSGPGRDDCAS